MRQGLPELTLADLSQRAMRRARDLRALTARTVGGAASRPRSDELIHAKMNYLAFTLASIARVQRDRSSALATVVESERHR